MRGVKTTLEELNIKKNWAGFVETTIVIFFQEHELEKLSLGDGKGVYGKIN